MDTLLTLHGYLLFLIKNLLSNISSTINFKNKKQKNASHGQVIIHVSLLLRCDTKW